MDLKILLISWYKELRLIIDQTININYANVSGYDAYYRPSLSQILKLLNWSSTLRCNMASPFPSCCGKCGFKWCFTKYHIWHKNYIMGLTGSGCCFKYYLTSFWTELIFMNCKIYKINSGHSRHDKIYFSSSLSTKQENKTHH